jgi:hypothetical protein
MGVTQSSPTIIEGKLTPSFCPHVDDYFTHNQTLQIFSLLNKTFYHPEKTTSINLLLKDVEHQQTYSPGIIKKTSKVEEWTTYDFDKDGTLESKPIYLTQNMSLLAAFLVSFTFILF